MDGWVHPGMINNLSSKEIKKYHSTGQTKKIACTKQLVQREQSSEYGTASTPNPGSEAVKRLCPKERGIDFLAAVYYLPYQT